MAITESDIVFRLTEPTGPAGDTNAQANPNASLGGFASTTEVDLDDPLNNLFDDVSHAERVAGDVEYRSIWIANESTTDTLTAPRVWISDEVAGGASYAISLDAVGVVDTDAASQGATSADESTAPAGASFSAPTTKAAGLAPGDVGPEQGFMLHIRRTTVAAVAALSNDGATIRVEQGD